VLDYLAAERVATDKIARIFAPAGLDLGAVTPEEIALSIVSQIVALRRGGTTRPLNLKAAILDLQTNDRPEGRAPDKAVTQCDAPTAG
jgi:xanthine dehydrogenase accessory factor